MITRKLIPAGVDWKNTGIGVAFENSCVTPTGRIIATKGISENYKVGYSDDNGMTWTWGDPIDSSAIPSALCVTSTGRVLIGITKKLYCSDDNGITWSQLTSVDLTIKSLCVTSTGRILMGRNNDAIRYSDDNGTTWKDTQSPSFNCSALCVTSTGRILAAPTSSKRIHYSDDNGITWTETQSKAINWVALCVTSTGRIIATSSGSSGMFYYSDDNGITWTEASEYTPKNWKKVRATPTGGLVAITPGNFYISYSADNGVTWKLVDKISSNSASAIGWYDICVTPTGRIYASGSMGAYVYSDSYVKVESTNKPLTKAQVQALIAECKAYVQSKRQS